MESSANVRRFPLGWIRGPSWGKVKEDPHEAGAFVDLVMKKTKEFHADGFHFLGDKVV